MAETKAAFRRRVGRLTRLVRVITTTAAGNAGGTTAVADSLLDYYPANAVARGLFCYHPVTFLWRRVSDYDTSSPPTITFSRAFSAQVAGSVALELYSTFPPEDFDEALRQALSEVFPYLATKVYDTSLTTAVNTYEYTIPSSILDMTRTLGARVEYQANTSEPTYPYQTIYGWTVRDNNGARTLLIPPHEHPGARVLRLTGFGTLAYPATDATSIPLDEYQLQLLAYKTAEVLYRSAVTDPNTDRSFFDGQAARYNALFEQHKDGWGLVIEPTPMRTNFDAIRNRGDISENFRPFDP